MAACGCDLSRLMANGVGDATIFAAFRENEIDETVLGDGVDRFAVSRRLLARTRFLKTLSAFGDDVLRGCPLIVAIAATAWASAAAAIFSVTMRVASVSLRAFPEANRSMRRAITLCASTPIWKAFRLKASHGLNIYECPQGGRRQVRRLQMVPGTCCCWRRKAGMRRCICADWSERKRKAVFYRYLTVATSVEACRSSAHEAPGSGSFRTLASAVARTPTSAW